MSLSGSHLEWPTKVEADSPFCIDVDDSWLDGNLDFNDKDIFASLPLSLIQQDKHLRQQYAEDSVYSGGMSPSFHHHQFISPNKEHQMLSGSTQNVDSNSHHRLVPNFMKREVADITSPPHSPGSYESPNKPSRSELASQLLTELDECKEEPFSEWLEEKIDLPIFEEFQGAREPVQDTQSLLLEFESVCGAVGIAQHQQLNHLTPPQSPPFHQSSQYAYHQPAPVNYATPIPHVISHPNWQPELLQLDQPSQTDLARELAAVEELVLRRAQDASCFEKDIKPIPSPVSIESDNSVSDCHYYPQNVQYSEEKRDVNCQVVATPVEHAYAKSAIDDSLQLEPFSPNSSSSCSIYGSSENDDEWAPSSSSSGASTSGRPKVYTRSKPYSRNPDDKRSRKKEQNKNAATRYRQKKKQEVEVLTGEEKVLRDKNDVLQGKCSDLQREVKYLKGLMRDLCRAKGLIK